MKQRSEAELSGCITVFAVLCKHRKHFNRVQRVYVSNAIPGSTYHAWSVMTSALRIL